MNVLDRWRIARCIEDGHELPPALARRVESSAALSEYCSNLQRLERSLRASSARDEPAPPRLAGEVLDRLRTQAPVVRRSRHVRGWALAAAMVALAGSALLVLTRTPPTTPPTGPRALGAVGRARDLGMEGPAAIARTPVEQPLVREARLLARDTRRAANMVLASFPSARPSGR
jgi:hypothetical protein